MQDSLSRFPETEHSQPENIEDEMTEQQPNGWTATYYFADRVVTLTYGEPSGDFIDEPGTAAGTGEGAVWGQGLSFSPLAENGKSWSEFPLFTGRCLCCRDKRVWQWRTDDPDGLTDEERAGYAYRPVQQPCNEPVNQIENP